MGLRIGQFNPAQLPLQSTDLIAVSRDGVTMWQTPLSSVISTAPVQSVFGQVGAVPNLSGAVTTTGSSATTLSAGVVGLSNMANLAASSIIGNNTGSPATPIALTTTQAKALLAIAESDVAGLTTDLANRVLTSTTVSAGTGLSGGGALSTNVTLSTLYGTVAGTSTQGNDTRVVNAEQITNKNVANGYCPLDSSALVPLANIPPSLIGAVTFQGTWNASTNTPTLTSSTGTKGYYYVVSVAGSTTLDGISTWNVGDWAIYSGTAWQKLDGITSEVTSVFGMTGAIANLSGAVTTSGSSVTTLSSGVVGLSNMANLAANSVIGNNTGSAATPIALTQTQLTAMVNNFSSTLSGTVAASGGGTANFLRADGTWTTPVASGTYLPLDGSQSMTGALNEAPMVTIASAATINILTAAANYIQVSGTTTITSLGTAQSGVCRILEFTGALTLTNGANLILPGAANITTVAGDTAIFEGESSTVWRCVSYQTSTGSPINIAIGAIGSSPNANGASYTTRQLVLQPASASFGGVVTTGTQTFAGTKTFSSTLTTSGGITNSNGFSTTGTFSSTGTGSAPAGTILISNSATASATSSATQCTMIGGGTAAALTSGNNNTALGSGTLSAISTQSQNTAVGALAFGGASTPTACVAVGYSSANSSFSYTDCTFIGANTDNSTSGLSNTTALGFGATASASNQMMLGNASVTDILGAGTSLNLFNATATTINFAGAATTLGIGASSGTLTLKNTTIVGAAATITLFNTVSTNISFAGAATTLSIGASTGTLTLNNVGLTLPNIGTATTATGGSQTLPANPVGFIVVTIGATSRKIPYYAT